MGDGGQVSAGEARGWRWGWGLGLDRLSEGGKEVGEGVGWPVLHSQTGDWVVLLVGPIGGRALDHRLMSVGLSSLTRSVVRSDSCWDRLARDETS